MKIRIATISMIIVLSSILLYCAPNNRNNNQDKYEDAEKMLEDASLNVTSKQKSTISACIKKHRSEGGELNRKMNAINKQIGDEMREHLVSGRAVDRDKIKKLVIEKKMLEAEVEYLTLITDMDILAALDEKQRAVLREQHTKNRQRR